MAEHSPGKLPLGMTVTVVSPDASLAREIAWVLTAVGHDVTGTNETGEGASWRRYSEADVLIVDVRAAEGDPEEFLADNRENPSYRIVLYDPKQSLDFAAWFAAGAHDALRLPLSRGELVARVRTSARWLEFERRLRNASHASLLPGWLSEAGLLARLAASPRLDAMGKEQTLVVAGIDWFSGFRNQAGQLAARHLANSAGRALRRAFSDNAPGAYLGGGRFALVVPVSYQAAAVRKMAEQAIADFHCRESHREGTPRPTLSVAIAPCETDLPPCQWLETGLETLQLAQHSGGNAIVDQETCRDELARWQQEMSDGNPFAHVVALDIMEHFPVILREGADQESQYRALARAGVECVPCVGVEGELLGVVDLSGEEPVNLPTETIAAGAGFSEIYETFSTRNCSLLIVESAGQPMGYLTCEGFLSLIEPVSPASFASGGPAAGELRSLVVPHLVAGEH